MKILLEKMFNSKDVELLSDAYASVYSEGYQRNPEKGEEDDDKKYGHVRGEKRPMPPRGHKDREAFEKFYAAQMGGKKKKKVKENFEVILSHLLDEGYADTAEGAVAILANMSEEWKESIIEEIGIVGPPKKGIDKIPGVRAARIAASNVVKASDYPASETPRKVGKHVIPTERSSPAFGKTRPMTSSEYRSGGPTGSGRRTVGVKDISGD
jgi:hypothetical protein